MEGEEPKSPSLQEDSPLNGFSERVAENVVGFQQFIDEFSEALEQDEKFKEMTEESYEHKKSYIRKLVLELSSMHNSLVDQCDELIEEVSKNCPSMTQNPHLDSADSSSPQVTLAPKFSTATGYDLRLKHGGGFYLSKCKGLSHSGSESSMSFVDKPAVPPVNDGALKVKATKDSGSESSMSSVNQPPVLPPVSDEALLEKISSLEEEVTSLKQKLQSLTVENGELKNEIEENVADIKLYMSNSKLETEASEEELAASKETVQHINEHMAIVLAEKVAGQVKHDFEMKDMNMKINQYMTEISQLKSTHEKKEKIWNGVTGQLKQELAKNSDLVDGMTKHMNILFADKSAQNILIERLKTELNSVKLEKAGVVSSLDNVLKLTDELKLKVVEVEREVKRQQEAMPNGE